MIQKILYKLLYRHHFWRTVGFDELSELYSAQLLRSLGINLIGLFTPIYLYTIGYTLKDIALFHVFWFLARPLLDIGAARIIAKIGPKHTMLLSAFVHVVYLGLVITLEDLKWPLALVAILGSFAYGLHLLAVMVDFSKVQHKDHGGKELGVMEIMQKIGGIVGPLIGGLIANYTDPRYTIGLAMLMLLVSAVPLFFSSEPVKIDQKITWRGMDFKRHARDYLSIGPLVVENAISVIVWPLYAAVFLLGDNTFAKLGAIAALSTIASLVVTHLIGSLIDARKGRTLLRASLVGNSFVHLLRVVAAGPLSVLGINLVNEPLTIGYRMPYMKGLFDSADSLPGYRIAYLASTAAVDSFARLLLWVAVWLALGVFGGQDVLRATFLVAAVCSYGVMVERFAALNNRRK